MSASNQRLPTLFIPHGGGPWPFMEVSHGPPDTWDRLAEHLRGLDRSLGVRPKAVLVISGHWEAERPTVNVSPNPPLLFDYYGFPDHTYRLTYPAPGSPELARRVEALLQGAGIAAGEDDERGFDHGVFIPFMLMYPDADVPVVQLSMQEGLDPAVHLAIGRALAPLRDEGVLIIGSGMSYHNLREFLSGSQRGNAASDAFDTWLAHAVEAPDPNVRDAELARWSAAPGALSCHPRSEHLLPLMVAAGAAGQDRGRRVFNDHIWGKAVSGFQFG
jgi:aromatic ring-opening dioxygenase catalytic subunit (LigB family)